MRRPSSTAIAILTLFAVTRVSVVCAQDVVPLRPGMQSAEVQDEGLVVYTKPDSSSPRRGVVALGTRLPILKQVPGVGCAALSWYQVAADAYVCGAYATPSLLAPAGVDLAAVPPGELLPLRVGVVRVDGTRRYAHPTDYDADEFVDTLGEGFAVVMGASMTYQGIEFVQTRDRYWVERSALTAPLPSTFVGMSLSETPLPIAWIRKDSTPLYAAASGAKVARKAERREIVSLAARADRDRVALADGTFVRRKDLAIADRAPRPGSVGDKDRWIDVNVDDQTLVAYEGDVPVYATLVSTGRKGKDTETPLGEFRIWVKLVSSDMDDLQRTDVEANYAVEAVPWVQYFSGGAGFHTAFWHDDFGTPRSHGCVNLSARDAKWLFDFTGPALPLGWQAALPSPGAPGTYVRVRRALQ